jgi:hypothetical protein
MSEITPGQAIPLADLSDREKLDLTGGAAQAYDYENRPRDRNWTAVPLDQVARLLTGALRSMEFEEPAPDTQARPGYVTVDARDIAIALNGCAGFTGDPASFASELHERLRRTVFADQAPEAQPAPELAAAMAETPSRAAGQAVREAFLTWQALPPSEMPAESWDQLPSWLRKKWESIAQAAINAQPAPELAAAMAETRKLRELLDFAVEEHCRAAAHEHEEKCPNG